MKKIRVKNAWPIKIQSFRRFKGGDLFVAEYKKEIPFSIKRVYFINNTNPSVIRGRHAHKSIRQVFFCINGSCNLRLHDGYREQVIRLSRPDEGLFLGPSLWREMSDFSDHCVILVLADKLHRPADYIRNFSEFIRYVRKLKK